VVGTGLFGESETPNTLKTENRNRAVPEQAPVPQQQALHQTMSQPQDQQTVFNQVCHCHLALALEAVSVLPERCNQKKELPPRAADV
jgi:hypothetical protein